MSCCAAKLTITAFLGAALCAAVWGGHGQVQVAGRVTDVTGAGVRDASIVFEGGMRSIHVATARDGSYIAHLPEGAYQMSVGATGFCEMRRGSFFAKNGTSIHFDFRLIICPSDWAGDYKFVELESAPGSGLRPLVLFGQSSVSGNVTRYTGPEVPEFFDKGKRLPGKYGQYPVITMRQRTYPVVLSYNLLTIRCTDLTYDREKQLVVGRGDVEIQEGKIVRAGHQVRVVLCGLTPKVELDSGM